MAYDVIMCNAKGETLCGSDGNFYIDKRLGHARVCAEVLEYRERFRKNFAHKAEFWTHYQYKGRIYEL